VSRGKEGSEEKGRKKVGRNEEWVELRLERRKEKGDQGSYFVPRLVLLLQI
jgi:hypothetical protein